MIKFCAVLLLTAATYVMYAQYLDTSQITNINNYSLQAVEQNPIPKHEFYSLWSDVAISQCNAASKSHNETPEKCRELVNQRSTACKSNMIAKTPDLVSTKVLTKQLGRQYLECVTPYYFCAGVEVKTDDEVLRYC